MVPNRLSELAAGAQVQHWIVLGPFVVKTSGHFEREYLYERNRILDVDYLAEDGGETRVVPEVGRSHINIGLGPKRLAWCEYPHADLYGMRVAGEIIYETVQRNCVVYAAASIESDSDCVALLDAYHSGMKAWVNGELICNEPYGMTKGVRTAMASKVIRLRRGGNLLLVKFRPGYICDGIDFSVRRVHVSPLASQPHFPVAFGRIRPLPYFTGSVDAPRQLIETAVANTSNVAVKVNVSIQSDSLDSKDMCEVLCDPGKVTPVRVSLATPPDAAGRPVTAVARARVYGKELEIPIEYQAAEPPRYDGTEMVLTSFHFDTTYHEEQRVYAMGAFDIMREYCRMHRMDPLFRSTISEIDYLKPYFDMFPEDRETLLAAFREGRSSPDVMYNQPNEQNCSGEALVRNFLYGQLFHGRVLGGICYCYGPGDVFGHPNQLSQIARKSGCIGVTWDKHIFNFPPFFNHLALDGSVLPHKRGEAQWEEVRRMGLSVRTTGIDQTPPTDWHHTLVPQVKQATYYDLMAAIHRDCEEKQAHLPVTSRDMSLYHAATAMSRTDLKIANRLGENTLLMAERFATLANLLGARYPEKALDKAWRQILCGQHHDSITGTHNEISFVDLMNSYREALELGRDVLERSLAYLGQAVDAGGVEYSLVVFNPLAWQRSDVVHATVEMNGKQSFTIQDHRGKNVPFEVLRTRQDEEGQTAEIRFVGHNLPSLGYRAYRVVPGKKALPRRKRDAGASIENEHYRIEVDPERGGGIVSLYDKEARREIIDRKTHHVGNELAILEEVPDRQETQHEFYTTGLAMFSCEKRAVVEVESGPVSRTLRARYSMGELCGVVQEITLYKGVKRIDFKTILEDYQGEDNLFCITFPTNLRGAAPIFEERFGVVTRNDSKGYLDFRTHRQVMFSDCAVYAANKWIEYGVNAVVQLGRNKYALGMVGLIAPDDRGDIAVAEDLQRILIRKGVTCTPWYDKGGPHWGSYLPNMDEDLLYTRFRISLGSGGKNAYARKLLSKQTKQVRRAFDQRLKKHGYACLFVKDADLRDSSWPPLPVLIVEAKTAADLRQAVKDLTAGFDATAIIRLPAEVDATGETHTVDNYGVAVINEGTYANSIEKGGVICMMLAHTCRWYGGTNTFPEGYLVPENKNHVFQYAVYPHKGTWRDGATQRAAYEFNFPLLARRCQPLKKPVLPPEHAFMEVRPDNIVLDAVKPFGNPIAAFERNGVCDAAKGIMLRLYDTHGVNSEAQIRFASGVQSAWTANLIEKRQADVPVSNGEFHLDVPAFSIETVGFVPAPPQRVLSSECLGTEAEPVQPVWVRSWEHDAESMPMGYEAVVCSISREVIEEDAGRVLRIKVNAVNDYTDATVSGLARVFAPAGWTATPAEIPFELAPLGYQTTEVRIDRPTSEGSGQIKLRFDHDGQTFQDVLEIGEAFDLQIEAANEGNGITVTMHNPTQETIEGEVSLVSPIETWPASVVGPYALLEITPRTCGLSLGPNETARIRFTVKGIADKDSIGAESYWAVAKLMSNGRIQMKRCDRRPPRRTLSDAKWLEALRERTKTYYEWVQ